MDELEQVDSPFAKRPARRLGFGSMLMLLLMVVAAGLGLLIYYAARVPAITEEWNAWLGRTDTLADRGDARRAQVMFAMFVYTAPMGLGILVWLLHLAINGIDRFHARSVRRADDEAFRMTE